MSLMTQRLCAALLAAALTACGGGSDSTPITTTPDQPSNATPRATILASGDARSASTGVNVTLGGPSASTPPSARMTTATR